jgi:REP element-mobilizing transposase RayT
VARPLRIEYPGAYHHITTRGVSRQDIFFDDEDHKVFLQQLAVSSQRWGVVYHGYCLMTNHYHLEVQTPEGHLSRALQWVNQTYASHVNRRYQRVGHLFQGRFKSVLVEAEAHLHELTRYVHLNPVRAGMVAVPVQYAWSSYRDYLGLRQPPDWLELHSTLSQFGAALGEQRQRYREFVEQGDVTNPLQSMQFGAVLGGDEFVRWVRQKLQYTDGDSEVAQLVKVRPGVSLESICEAVRREYAVSQEVLREKWRRSNAGRDVVIYLAKTHARQSLREIGAYCGQMSPSSVSLIHKRLSQRMATEPGLRKTIRRLEAELGVG